MPTPATLPAGVRRLLGTTLLSTLLVGAAQAQAPVVTSVFPARNSLQASRITQVAVTYNQPLRSTAATQEALKVFSQQAGGKKAGTGTVLANTLRFTASGTVFKPGETVWATATAGVQGSNGTAAVPHVFQFTTATVPSSGTFDDAQVLPNNNAAATTRGVIGDVDGDGYLDVLTTNATSAVSVYRGTGVGSFDQRAPVILGNGTDVTGLALADMDADGDLDLLAGALNSTSANTAQLFIRFNNGSGTFSGGQNVPVPLFLNPAILPADVDGDGDLDVVVPSGTGGSVLFNDGRGAITRTVLVASAASPASTTVSLTTGDLDSDGDVDLLLFTQTASVGNRVEVHLNQGDGTFGLATQHVVLPSSGSYPAPQLSLGDVDGDGDLDLATGGGLYLNTRGTLASSAVVNSAGTTLGDVDGDGDLDLLWPSGGTVIVRLNNGRAGFTTGQQWNTGMSFISGTSLGDLNSDGRVDLLAVGERTVMGSNQPLLVPPSSTYRLNAGGPGLSTSRGPFAADQYYSDSSAVFVTTAPIANTTEDALYQSERYSTNGQLRYAVPVADGLYNVVLHFAETYWTQPGQRVFNIALENTIVRTNYDIVAEVGPRTATTETYQVRVRDGLLNLELIVPYLSGGRDQAKLSALEITPVAAGAQINAGGLSLNTARGLFSADQSFSAASATASYPDSIAGTSDDALYQSERYSTNGVLSYSLPVANREYTVVLHFAEFYWTQPGQRVFNIEVEGRPVRTNYDIVAQVGPRTATTETFVTTVTDGVLNIDLRVPYRSGGVDQAKLSALEVFVATGSNRPLTAATQPAGGAGELSVYPTPTPNGHFTLTYSAARAQAGTLTLVDPLGRMVHAQRVLVQAGPNHLRVQPAAVRAGLYQLVLRLADGQRLHQKVLVQP